MGLVLREKGYRERLLGEYKKTWLQESFIASNYYLFEELWSPILGNILGMEEGLQMS